MYCSFCSHGDTKVIDSRLTAEGRQVRRRRECLKCTERFTTFESAELVMPHVRKRDNRREPFDIAKLRSGIEAALRKRPVGSEALERAIEQIAHRIRVTGERDVESGYIGGLVMDQLRRLDEVAYVRFASVYRSFQDVTEFEEEIRLLKMRSDAGAERRQLPLLPDDADDAGQSNR